MLTGIISDRNGPWLSERLREIGVDTEMIQIVGDRPEDLLTSLRSMRDAGMSVIVTSGGLGPTADDLTAEIVGRFSGREMVLDEPLEERIAEILRPMMARWPDLEDAVRRSNRKQAVDPAGATVLEPVGTAPGLVVPPADGAGRPTVVVLPGPPRELQPMWARGGDQGFQAAIAGATEYRREIVRLFGIPESEIANTLRAADATAWSSSRLEITTCLRRGEIEIATRYEPAAQGAYDACWGSSASAMATRCSPRRLDDRRAVAGLLPGRRLGDGRIVHRRAAGRPADRSRRVSAYFLGGASSTPTRPRPIWRASTRG